jgi:N4-gp56 family major capsid protein
MATTTYGVNDAMAVKLWSKTLYSEALKATSIAPLIGKGSDAVIQLKSELDKGAGDKVTFGLRAQLTGDGVTEGQTLEGNEEALSTYSDSLFINELLHAVRSKNDGKSIDAKRVPFNLRSEAKDGLRDWWAKRMSVSFFNQACGYTAESRTIYTGMQATTAPSSTRRLACNATTTTADASLGSSDKMMLKYLDYAREIARTGGNSGTGMPIRPIMIGGEEKYVVYLHPYQVVDLRVDASTAGNWFDIQKAALQGGKVSGNPIYTGALGEYNGMVLRESFDVTNGVNAGTGVAITTVKRAVLLGAQAAVAGFAGETDSTSFSWVEELFDYERELGVSAQGIWGLKKTRFNSVDFGTVVIASYGAAHA